MVADSAAEAEGRRRTGGPGGFGGPGGDLIRLADNEVVAKELKLTDRQKAKVKQIAERKTRSGGEVFQQLRQQTDIATQQAAQQAAAAALQGGGQIDPSVDARGSGAGNALAGTLNQRGYQPQVYGGRIQGAARSILACSSRPHSSRADGRLTPCRPRAAR